MIDWTSLQPDKIKLLGKHFTSGRRGKSVEFVGIHYMAGNLSTEGCWQVWQTREASAHYCVEDDGTIGQTVYDRDTSWALGDFDANCRSINIEHASMTDGSVTEKTLDAGAHLVAAICLAYDLGRPQWLVNVFPHCHFMATSCPGQLYKAQKDSYISRAQYWYDEMTKPSEPVKPPLPDALKQFSDLDSNAWYISPLEKAVSAGFINGYGDGRIGPDDTLTRGQAVCMVANAADAVFDHPFSDVTASPFYYDAVAWAKSFGIVSGSDGEFRPNDPCTRAEFAAMLANWKDGTAVGEPSGYTDWETVPDWAKNAVAWAIENAVISGNAGRIRPNDPCTRAEGAAMLVNLLL